MPEMLLTQSEHIEVMENDHTNLQCVLPKCEQLTDVPRAVMRRVELLREQKEELVHARHRLQPRLTSGEVAT